MFKITIEIEDDTGAHRVEETIRYGQDENIGDYAMAIVCAIQGMSNHWPGPLEKLAVEIIEAFELHEIETPCHEGTSPSGKMDQDVRTQ